MNEHQYCVILAGGVGSRFWPLSRKNCPKQFLEIFPGDKSLMRLTYERMLKIVRAQNIIVVSLEMYRDLVKKQIPELPDENLLLEPYRRNTAPSITYAALELYKRDPEAVMVVTPADHIIEDDDKYAEALLSAMDTAVRNPVLLTLGIKPTRPDTNFGYIQIAGGGDAISINVPAKAKSFTEKPDADLAKVFLESGEFLWNSGIFVWQTPVILEEISKYIPALKKIWVEDKGIIEDVVASCQKISIDYAVMEKSDKVWILPVDFGWLDLGNWVSMYERNNYRDLNGNVTGITGKSLIKECADNVIMSTNSKKLIAVKGLRDFVVVDTPDALMICPKNDSKIKELIAELSMPEFEEFR